MVKSTAKMPINFKLLLAGQLVSQVGDKFHMIALALWVLETTGSSAKMGAVLAASLVPSLILGLLSGAFIDRYDKKKIIVGTDIIRGVVLLGFAWMFAQVDGGQMNFYLILVLQGILSVNAAFFDPTIPAVIPGMVSREQLGRANAMHQLVNGFALVGGAALGGMALAGMGYVWIFILNGVSFLVSGFFESFITLPQLPERKTKTTILGDAVQGYGYLLNHHLLMLLLFMVLIIHFFVGGIEVFMPVIAKGIQGGGPKTLGLFQAALGCGTLIMALVLSKLSTPGKEKFSLFSSVFFMGFIQAGAFCINRNWDLAFVGFILVFFLWGGCLIRASIAFKTLLQKYTDPAYAGRVFALASTIGNAAIPGAMVAFGLAMDWFGFEDLLLCSGLILMALSLISYAFFKEEDHDAQK